MDHAPDTVGPYRVLRLIGAGGMGRVYLAEDTRLFRRVALKEVVAGDDKEAYERLMAEARAAARLSHPGIASVFDVVERGAAAYIVMEYVPGETLDRRVSRGRLPVAEVLAIAAQATQALAEAHRLGVIHRDLKPANIAVTESGDIKILDFGLAKSLADPTSSSSGASGADGADVGFAEGSPPYVPPEHFRGQPIRRRGDIYSLGVTLFELLTGQRPFVGRDFGTTMMAVLTAPTPRVRDFLPEVPDAVDELVWRAMARRPEDRPASVVELRHEIERILADLTGRTMTAQSPPRWRVPLTRRAFVAAGVMAVAAAAAMAIRTYTNPATPSNPGRPIVAVMPLAMAGSDPDAAPLGIGIADVLTADLSKLEGVTVIATAPSPAEARTTDPTAFARKLGATTAVSGSVQKVGNQIRLVVRITRPPSNAVAWSGSFDGSLDHIFELQRQVTLAVSDAVAPRPTTRNRTGLETQATADPQAFTDYSLGMSLYERWDIPGNLDRAIEALSRATARDRRFARAFAGLGEALWRRYLMTNDTQWAERARDSAVEALRLDPNDVAVECALARIYIGTGKLDEAAEELRRAVADHPSSDLPHVVLGKYLQEAGKRDEAIREYQKAIVIRPNYPWHYMELGTLYYRMGRYDDAAGAFQKVAELAPDNSSGFQMLGAVQHARGNRPAAIANYKRAIALAPNASAYTNLGAAYYDSGDYQRAAAAFERAVELDPKSGIMHRNLGDLYRKLGREDAAIRSYRRARERYFEAISINPRDAEAMSALAVCEAKLREPRSALVHAATAADLRPDSASVIYHRAVVYALVGRSADGLQTLGKAVRAGYSLARIETDDDVALLRRMREYSRVIDAAKESAATISAPSPSDTSLRGSAR